MRSTVWLVSLMLLTLPLFVFNGEGVEPITSDEERYVEVLYTTTSPDLDGYILDQEWQTQFSISYFDAFDGKSFREIYPETGSDEEFTNQTDLAVTFYLLYDETYLYFAANVTDYNIVIDSGTTFWRDDGVELLIDGAYDMDEDQRAGDPWPGYEDGTTLLALADGSYFHDYSNGTPFERHFGPSEDWYVATRTVPARNYYIVEMRVRLDAIASPQPNSTIGLNIGVNDDDTGAESKTALKWSGTATGPGEIPTFKNETLWGTAYLKPYINAKLPDRVYVDEDMEVVFSSNLSSGNHPDFDTDTNYTWNLPLYDGFNWNNHTSYGPEFIYTFNEPRSYYVLNLEVRDPSNQTDKTSTYVYVHDITPPVIENEDVVVFEDEPYDLILNVTDNVGIDHVNWSLYDDGWINRTTISPLFDHTFQHPGNYTISYVVYDPENNSANGSSTISVLDNSPPIITENITHMRINTSETINLTAPYSYDDSIGGPDSNLTYLWSFSGPYGDYEFQGVETSVNIPVPGEYSGFLMVIDGVGLFAVVDFNMTVVDDTPPIPAFFLPMEIGELTTVHLNASSSFDNDPAFWNLSTFNWTIELSGKIGFVEYQEGPLVDIVFPFPGTGTVTLLMVDPWGNNASLQKTINVLDITPPSARLWFNPDHVDQGEKFYINITGSYENVKLVSVHYTIYSMTPDGYVELMSTPFFGIRLGNMTPEEYINIMALWVALQEPGTYLISITLEDSSGLKDNASQEIIVRDSILPKAALNRTIAYVNVMEGFYISGSESTDEVGPLSYVWLLENTTRIGEGATLAFIFMDPGEYNITLRVTDSGGNFDTINCKVIVSDPSLTTPAERTDYTMVYVIWSITGLIILLGIVALLFWARRKKAVEAAKNEEE